jgi:hypothetical protein
MVSATQTSDVPLRKLTSGELASARVFQLTKDEYNVLLSQTARAKAGCGARKTLPYAFIEHGVAMLSSVLRAHAPSR